MVVSTDSVVSKLLELYRRANKNCQELVKENCSSARGFSGPAFSRVTNTELQYNIIVYIVL